MDFLNNSCSADSTSFVSSTTPHAYRLTSQYNTVLLHKKDVVETTNISFEHQIKPLTQTNDNITSVFQIGKKAKMAASETASFYVYGGKKTVF